MVLRQTSDSSWIIQADLFVKPAAAIDCFVRILPVRDLRVEGQLRQIHVDNRGSALGC